MSKLLAVTNPAAITELKQRRGQSLHRLAQVKNGQTGKYSVLLPAPYPYQIHNSPCSEVGDGDSKSLCVRFDSLGCCQIYALVARLVRGRSVKPFSHQVGSTPTRGTTSSPVSAKAQTNTSYGDSLVGKDRLSMREAVCE